MNISKTLVSLREEHGLSKRAVSEKTDIPYTTYIKYESGERKDVSMIALVKLADFYGVSTDYLLGRSTEEKETLDELAGEFNMSLLEKKILEGYLELPRDLRGDFMDFLYNAVQEVKQESES